MLNIFEELNRVKSRAISDRDALNISVINGAASFFNAWENALEQVFSNELVYTAPDEAGKRRIVRPVIIFWDRNDGYVNTVRRAVDYAEEDVIVPDSYTAARNAMAAIRNIPQTARWAATGFLGSTSNLDLVMDVVAPVGLTEDEHLVQYRNNAGTLFLSKISSDGTLGSVTLGAHAEDTVASSHMRLILYWVLDVLNKFEDLPPSGYGTSNAWSGYAQLVAADIFCMAKWMREVVNPYANIAFKYLTDEVYNKFSQCFTDTSE